MILWARDFRTGLKRINRQAKMRSQARPTTTLGRSRYHFAQRLNVPTALRLNAMWDVQTIGNHETQAFSPEDNGGGGKSHLALIPQRR